MADSPNKLNTLPTLQAADKNPLISGSNRPYVIGMDPGFYGGLAVYDHATRELIDVISTPLRKKVGANGRLEVDRLALGRFFERYAAESKYAVLEEVGAMPGQGVVSMFRFGEAYGILLGYLAAYYIPHLRVSPCTWKMMMKCSRDKNACVNTASELFPKYRRIFEGVKCDGLAEAALIAVYGALYTFRK